MFLNETKPPLEEALEHFGVKGMHWGVRRSGGTSGVHTGPLVSKEEAKAHNTMTDHIAAAIKSAKHEGHMERIIDTAHLNGRVEGNMKVHHVDITPDGKISYELSLYRVTAGRPSTHSGDGVKIQHVFKKIARDPRPGMSLIDNPELFKHTNLQIEEVLEHFGVRGMHWGQRRSRVSGSSSHDPSYDFYNEARDNSAKRKIAIGALALAGTAATVLVLHQTGHLKIPKMHLKL